MKKKKSLYIIFALLICPLFVGIILKYLPSTDKSDISETTGDYSPGIVEGDYYARDAVVVDKIEVENVNIYAEPETAKDVEESIEKVSQDGENIIIKVYDRETNKMKEVKLSEGKVYTSFTRKGARVDYMQKEDKVHLEYTAPGESWAAYYIMDSEGKVIDYKFPYDLEEYTVEIPEELELRRQEEPLSNGWKHVHVNLKWNKSVDLIYDDNDVLKQLSIKGGSRIYHNAKRIVVLDPRKK